MNAPNGPGVPGPNGTGVPGPNGTGVPGPNGASVPRLAPEDRDLATCPLIEQAAVLRAAADAARAASRTVEAWAGTAGVDECAIEPYELGVALRAMVTAEDDLLLAALLIERYGEALDAQGAPSSERAAPLEANP